MAVVVQVAAVEVAVADDRGAAGHYISLISRMYNNNIITHTYTIH